MPNNFSVGKWIPFVLALIWPTSTSDTCEGGCLGQMRTLYRLGDLSANQISEDIKKSWEKAGHEFGWTTTASNGLMGIEDHPSLESLPAFRISSWKRGRLSILPAPSKPFGLEIWPKNLMDDDLKELPKFSNLQDLILLGSNLSDVGMSYLAECGANKADGDHFEISPRPLCFGAKI